jgi:hypothetical protein
MAFVAIKMRRRQGGRSGAYLNGYVTDEQRGRRPIFIATLRAAAGWMFFRVAGSLRINQDRLVARALKNSQLTSGESHVISRQDTSSCTRAQATLLALSRPIADARVSGHYLQRVTLRIIWHRSLRGICHRRPCVANHAARLCRVFLR